MTRSQRAPIESTAVFRGGRVHVLADRCATCVFRPGNLMDLEAGRLRSMIDTAVEVGGSIPCHSTIRRDDVAPAICRGFYDRHAVAVPALRLARSMEAVAFDPQPPPKD